MGSFMSEVMGASADPKLLKAAAEAHHKAIGSISGPNGVTSRADWDAVNAALGRVVASVPKAQVMDVYDAVSAITDPGVPAYMKSLVKSEDAEKAYKGFLEFKDVVEKNQVTAASAPASVPSGDKIGDAAKALSDASYPFIKDLGCFVMQSVEPFGVKGGGARMSTGSLTST